MTALYNEIDPKAADWLRELIRRGLIAPGDVVGASIEDLTPNDLRGYTQVHFFAGIGVWSYALRCAGWPDDRPVWTGSCPCQPFSAAGKGGGFADERHLWPAFHWLIEQCRPAVVFGEQVASKDGLAWLDLVQADLEGTGYASRAVDLCAAGVGAPHIRQRLWWVAERLADAVRNGAGHGPGQGLGAQAAADGGDGRVSGQRLRAGVEGAPRLVEHPTGDGRIERRPEPSGRGIASGRSDGGLADADCRERLGIADGEGRQRDGQATGWQQGDSEPERGGAIGRLADTDGGDASEERQQRSGEQRQQPTHGVARGLGDADGSGAGRDAGEGLGAQARSSGRGQVDGYLGHGADVAGGPCDPGPTNGLWRDADWLFCRDGKWRPVEPSTFPLAHGAPARVGRLRGYGNAIVAPAAQAFIEAYLDAEADRHLRLTEPSAMTTDIFE